MEAIDHDDLAGPFDGRARTFEDDHVGFDSAKRAAFRGDDHQIGVLFGPGEPAVTSSVVTSRAGGQ
ncbi:unannotated protein [freshwater metagenome]|uniref:Unannotated protein n=1 Tax=freshwater metagenome TaxID=449393 RepID=A0A6J7AVH7_9ZZZZ